MEPQLTTKPWPDLPMMVQAFAHKPGRKLSLAGTSDSTNLKLTHPDVWSALSHTPKIQNYYAPAPTKMNGAICSKDDLKIAIPVYSDVKLMRGMDADGVYDLKPGDAFVMSPANCMLIVAYGKYRFGRSRLITSHAGRNSLWSPNDEKHGVAAQIVATMKSGGIAPEALRIWLGLSISAGPHFEHLVDNPKWQDNKKWVDYALSLSSDCVKNNGTEERPDYSRGWLDIKQIAKHQLMRLGVPAEQITLDSVCTHCDTDANGVPIWGSNVRGANERNLVMVYYE